MYIKESDYLHPAALSFRVYILPMSPIPMMPITKPSMSDGTLDEPAIALEMLEPSNYHRCSRGRFIFFISVATLSLGSCCLESHAMGRAW